MTVHSSIAARRGDIRTWVVNPYRVNGELAFIRMSWDDRARDGAWCRGLLEEHGLAAGDFCVITTAAHLSVWLRAFEPAILGIGARWGATELWGFDAHRSAMFMRRFRTRFVLGLDAEVAQAWEGVGGYESLERDRPLILAWPGALPVLEKHGLPGFRMERIGPALAVETPARDGLHVNGAEWNVEAIDGELYVTTIGPREHQVRREPTGRRGAVLARDTRGADIVLRVDD
ncbi:MAG: hypothetical protein AB7Q97_10270 [Gammaproteobacteria bacterium]